MKLSNKLTLFITISKLAIVLLFVVSLPFIVDKISSEYSNYILRQQKQKVLGIIAQNGVESYLLGNESYGSYTLLKEEYISLGPANGIGKLDTIETADRMVERDTLSYRILSHTFKAGGKAYLLEIGRATSINSQYNGPLQRLALYVLLGLIVLTVIIDLVFMHYLFRPLGAIIESKLVNQQFPFASQRSPVKTTTSDFRYLDSSLMLLMEQVNEAFRKEREFTANASHELMTPVSILQNKIENLMNDPGISTETQQNLTGMLTILGRLKKIVNALLLISRIENSQFAKSDEISVNNIFKEILSELEEKAIGQDVSLKLQLSKDLHVSSVNKDLIFQLFYNIINNAIRYNRQGGNIFISNTVSKSHLNILVEDTGIGIPKDELPLIFNRFKKANLTQAVGYGLGLSIVKSIADYHEIKIDVESEVGTGTTFCIAFPAPYEKQKQPGFHG